MRMRFIRAAFHLCHRGRAIRNIIAASQVCCGSRYGLSHPAAYQKALGGEPQWTSDVVHWFTICPPHKERLCS
jgi:hypothetical protein